MQKQLEATKSITADDLKSLAAATGPCITILIPTQPAENTSRQDHIRLREMVRQADEALVRQGLDVRSTSELLDPVRGMTGDEWDVARGTLVILRSPEIFRHFQIPDTLPEGVFVGDSFHLLPVLPAVTKAMQEFYVLALSQKHVRLLLCTPHSAHEVPLPKDAPPSLDVWLNTRLPNESGTHGDNKHAEPGSTGGSFTSTTDMDNKDQHIANFYKTLNKHLAAVLRDDQRPLVPVGVEYELASYKEINSYPHYVVHGVAGSPESFKGGEMHRRALEAVQVYFEQPLEKALAQWEKFGGTDRVSTKVDSIVKAAFEARIASLFVEQGARLMGAWDRSNLRVSTDQEVEDLISLAVNQTIATGGEVFVSTPEKVPGDNPVAAILRY